MSLHEEAALYRKLSGDYNPKTPISRIGGYLDGYERAKQEFVTDPDTVSRKEVLDAVDTITKWSLLDRNGCHVGVGMKYRDVKETVKGLPSSPSRPHGHWKFVHPLQEDDPGAYICSECGTGDWKIDPTEDRFCKFCGSDNREDGEKGGAV